MAKKKKAKKSRKSYRSRKGGMLGAIDFTNTLAVIAGAVAGKMVDKVIPESIDPKISAAGKIGLGLFLPNFVKDGKTKALLQGVGSGMIAVGALDLATSLGVISGVNDDDMLAVSLEGIEDLPVINGSDDMPVINGDTSVLGADVLAGTDVETDEDMIEFD